MEERLVIDCDACRMQHSTACADCVMSFLLEDGPVELSDVEQAAIAALAGEGLVPRLRLIPDPEARSSVAG